MPRKRKMKCNSNAVVTRTRMMTRQQARKNNPQTPEARLPTGSLASSSRSRKIASTYPRAAKRARGRELNEGDESVMIISDDSDKQSVRNDDDEEYLRFIATAKESYDGAYVSEELGDKATNPSLQASSDKDSQSLSESQSDYEVELVTYERRHSYIPSNSRAGLTGNALRDCVASTSKVDDASKVANSSNARIINDVRCNLDAPFSAFIEENVPVQNVPQNSAGDGIGTTPMEEPSTASAAEVERVLEPACNLARASSFGLTEIISMYNLESGMDEVQSPAVGTVLGYTVQQKFVSILRRIIDKHGDIAANCEMQSIRILSSSLESVCEIIQLLQEKSFSKLHLAEITALLVEVRDLKKMGMRVEWLEIGLEEMEVTKRAIKESSSLKEKKLKSAERLKELTKKQEEDRTQLNEFRTQTAILTDSISEQKRKLEFYKAKTQELEMNENLRKKDMKIEQDNARILDQTSSDLIHRVKYLIANPLVDRFL